ncbi:class I SAM-dependent methyltransferase [Paenibacillus septentrionalis]|uniref:Class I SAM-dependent methyltransferase n=1 Tax=Paenibacillus septentrionalis TaxID=429342 RepID=A0ABW1V339_9BACL
MGFISVLTMAQRWVAERVERGETVIDATAGGGVDTLQLAQLVGPKGRVLAFDIQQDALDKTAARLKAYEEQNKLAPVQLIKDSHSKMSSYAAAPVAAIMFNLGYFPGGDHQIITVPHSTLSALEQGVSLLRPGGILTCVLYPGHAGGETEAAAVEQWAARLPHELANVVLYRQPQRPAAPYLIAVERKNITHR